MADGVLDDTGHFKHEADDREGLTSVPGTILALVLITSQLPLKRSIATGSLELRDRCNKKAFAIHM